MPQFPSLQHRIASSNYITGLSEESSWEGGWHEASSRKVIIIKLLLQAFLVHSCFSNETIGDIEIGKYFDIEFGFKNRELNEDFKGYLVAYAKALGAKVSLIELPKPNNKEEIEHENYKEKLYNGIVALLKDYDR